MIQIRDTATHPACKPIKLYYDLSPTRAEKDTLSGSVVSAVVSKQGPQQAVVAAVVRGLMVVDRGMVVSWGHVHWGGMVRRRLRIVLGLVVIRDHHVVRLLVVVGRLVVRHVVGRLVVLVVVRHGAWVVLESEGDRGRGEQEDGRRCVRVEGALEQLGSRACCGSVCLTSVDNRMILLAAHQPHIVGWVGVVGSSQITPSYDCGGHHSFARTCDPQLLGCTPKDEGSGMNLGTDGIRYHRRRRSVSTSTTTAAMQATGRRCRVGDLHRTHHQPTGTWNSRTHPIQCGVMLNRDRRITGVGIAHTGLRRSHREMSVVKLMRAATHCAVSDGHTQAPGQLHTMGHQMHARLVSQRHAQPRRRHDEQHNMHVHARG